MFSKLKKFFWLIPVAWVLTYFIPVSNTTFSEQFKQENIMTDQLNQVRKTPLKSIEVAGVVWQYYKAGTGDKTLLFIHGMGGSYDLWWNQLFAFEQDFTVISYTLPREIHSLEQVAKGILHILDVEKISQVIPIGTSMGGYITQYLVQKHPDRISKAVFGNTFPPNDQIKQANAFKRKTLPFLPKVLVAHLFQKKIKNDMKLYSEDNPLLTAFLLSIPFDKQAFVGRYDIVIDTLEIQKNNPKIARIPKLIFESDNDPMIPPDLRLKLKTLYPDAQVHTFKGKGHFPYVNAREQYNKILRAFVDE